LGSDTYKRLNLGLVRATALCSRAGTPFSARAVLARSQIASALATLAVLSPSLAAAPTGGSLAAALPAALLPATCALSLAVCSLGFFPEASELTHGLLSVPRALAAGTASLAASLLAPPTRVAGAYDALVATLAACAVTALAAPSSALALAALPAAPPATLLVRAAGAGALPACAGAVALADAAARGRLGASTFRALNAALGISALFIVVVHAHTALIARAPVAAPFAAAPVAAAAAAALCVHQWAVAKRSKK
jgi:hypothetical protein